MRILILVDEYPARAGDGWGLRVYNLCEQILKENECFLALLPQRSDYELNADELGFEDIWIFGDVPRRTKSWTRHFRLSDARKLEASAPEYVSHARSEVRELAERWKIDVVVCFTAYLAEISGSLDRPTILDLPDSRALTVERRIASRGVSMIERWFLSRQVRRERHVISQHDAVTTISAPDKARMALFSPEFGAKIHVVPNGVAEAALLPVDWTRHQERSVVFWGNLDFPPNWTAVNYFFEEIFKPHLSSRGINWHIVGRGAGEQLSGLKRHPGITFHGFQEDLFGFVRNMGVMVNPMVEGSGLKNKVLEAFALGLPVVSTSMGVDAIGAEHDYHLLVANRPDEFAQHVIRLLDDREEAIRVAKNGRALVESTYTWTAAGHAFVEAIGSVFDSQPAATDTTKKLQNQQTR
jgi:glycosyltransferase involved in cell wall biosynthesis